MYQFDPSKLFGNIWEQKGYMSFLVAFLVGIVYYIILTSQLRLIESWLLPRFVLYAMGGLVLIELVRTLLNPYSLSLPAILSQKLPDILENEKGNTKETVQDDLDEVVSQTIDPKKFIIATGWVSVFIVSLEYIGFFTTILAFAFVYPFYNLDQKLKYRVTSSIVASISTTAFLWFLFIYVMQTYSIYRYGPLP